MFGGQQANSKQGTILILGVLAIFLSACGSLGAPPEPVTIHFTYPSNIMHYYEDFVTEFQAQNPHITVELDPVSPSELSTLSPAETDVFVAAQFDLPTFQAQNAILSLNPFIARDSTFDVDDYYPGTLDLLTFSDETWGLPVGTDLLVFYFNKELFDQAGLPHPQSVWTWDEFLDAAELITNADEVPTPVYGYSAIEGYLDSLAIIGAHGGSIFDDMQHPTQATFNDPLTVEAMEFYADLFHEYQVAPTPSIARENYSSAVPMYEGARRGRTGMWIQWFSERGGMGAYGEWRFDWGIAPLPQGDVPYMPFVTNSIYVMSAASSHPDESWAWMSFLSQQMPQLTIPARRSLIESTDFENQMGPDIAYVIRSSIPYAAPIPLQNWADFFDDLGYFFQAVETIMEGTATPQEALDWAQEQALK